MNRVFGMCENVPPLIKALLDAQTFSAQQIEQIETLLQDEALDVFPVLLGIEPNESKLRDEIAQCFHLGIATHIQESNRDFSHIEDLLKKYEVYPLDEDNLYLTLVCCDPSDINLLAVFYFHTNKKILLKVCTYSQYLQVRRRLEDSWGSTQISLGLENHIPSHALEHQQLELSQDLESDASPVAKLVANIIEQALIQGASDLHFEPQHNSFMVRQRVDGVLQFVSNFPVSHITPINTRLKLMAKMDITEKRRPQDGRIEYQGKQDLVDIRVSSLATMWGEKLVLRLLSSAHALLKIPQLGMLKQQLSLFHQVLNKKQGLILVTGPTGSGKTQTLYAALDWLNHPSVNISTAEDPIEISLDGLNQTQIKPIINYDFAQALKTFLRQDPDIIMLGEIRDQETADISVKASQTGHLVLSTLHTNNAIQAIYRLENLGISLFNIVTSVRLIIAQRLVRKLCPHCRIKDPDKSVYQANTRGCIHCHYGYKGRIGVYEFLLITPKLAEYIKKSMSEQRLIEVAKESLFSSLSEQAQDLINQGITDQSEINRVLG